MLPIPANYYDDVAAKWGLDDEQHRQLLRRLNLLYDRDDNGEFLHAYTDTFDDRFFFEIVERRGDYQQYGAANAACGWRPRRSVIPASRLSGLLA